MKKIFVLIVIFISALIYVNAQVCDVTISTTFAGGSGEDGNMFNITAVNTVTINQFEGNINGDGGIQIYYKSGTYQGSEDNPGAWIFIGEVNVTSAGIGVPTPIPVTVDVTIPAGQTYAFYITGDGTGATLVYTDGTQEDSVYVYDANLEIKEGIGIKYPFFTTFTPKVWNGIVHYTPPFISLSFESTLALCPEVCDGSATVTPSGGNAPYTYLWDDGQTDSTATGLCMGTNEVTVTDADGCTKTVSVNISAGSPISLSFDSTWTTCPEVCDGSATVTPSGGTEPYTYLWDDGQTDSTAAGLCMGIVTVTATDANGCTKTDSVSILAGSISLSFFSTDVSSCTVCDGIAIVTPSGGAAPYTYLWNDGQTDSTATGLCAGTNTVTVADSIGCMEEGSVTISSYQIKISLSYNQFICGGTCTGYAQAWVSEGVPPYTYLWSNGETDEIIYDLCAGNYSVTVTDANECSASKNLTILSFNELSLSTATYQSQCGICDGWAAVSTSGGTSPYNYLWSDGQATQLAAGLCVGIYTVTVTDYHGCTETDTVSITSSSGMSLSFSSSDASCGVCDGTGIVTPSGGSVPYNYLWSDAQTDSTATGLCPGTYQVTVTDALGCPIIDNITISEPFPVSLSVSSVAAACDSCNGSATAIASGGAAPYTYLWSNGQTDSTATELCNGIYPVTVTNAETCSATGTANITGVYDIIESFMVLNNITCFGDTNGTAELFIPWPLPVDIVWSNGDSIIGSMDTIYIATDLAAGIHTVTVTDADGCMDIDSVVIWQPSALNLTINKADANCGINDGMAWIIVNGAIPPYTYLWSNGATQDTISGLYSGVYTVTVTDANGCEEYGTGNVNELDAPIITVDSIENISCNGGNNGAIYLTAAGGVLPYNFLWSNSDTTEDVSNLTAGGYTVSVTGANSCQSIEHIIINEPPDSMVLAAFQIISQGAAYVLVTGGTPPYSYLWSSGGTEFTETGLYDGVYTVTVTDNNGCTALDSITITGFPLTYTITGEITLTDTNVSVTNVEVYLSGDINNITYPDTTGFYYFSDLLEGNYTVTPLLSNFEFTPDSYSYSPLDTNMYNQDFIGNKIFTYLISGYVTLLDSNYSVTNVAMILSGDTNIAQFPDNIGYYCFSDLLEGYYTVTPFLTDFEFLPNSYSYSPLDTNQYIQNFIGSLNNYIQEYLSGKIRIYPNPTKNKLYIEFGDNNIKIEKLTLFNTLGVILYTKEVKELNAQKIKIDISDFKAGIYYLVIQAEDGILMKKISVIR